MHVGHIGNATLCDYYEAVARWLCIESVCLSVCLSISRTRESVV